jgi:hypothetical protein
MGLRVAQRSRIRHVRRPSVAMTSHQLFTCRDRYTLGGSDPKEVFTIRKFWGPTSCWCEILDAMAAALDGGLRSRLFSGWCCGVAVASILGFVDIDEQAEGDHDVDSDLAVAALGLDLEACFAGGRPTLGVGW